MKFISLTKGKSAKVDDEWFDYLNQFKWYLSHGYAVRWSPRNHYKRHQIHMHRIVNGTLNGFHTDHKDRDRLNNQKANLRTTTPAQNNYNRGAKGYNFHKASNKWRAYIQINKKSIHLGLFLTEVEAKLARESAWKSVQLS